MLAFHYPTSFNALQILHFGIFIGTTGVKKDSSRRLSFEDDHLYFLGLESLSAVKYFTRLQAGDTVFHSKMYKRVSRINSFTIM